MMACSLLSLLCVETTARNSPTFACSTQALCFEFKMTGVLFSAESQVFECMHVCVLPSHILALMCAPEWHQSEVILTWPRGEMLFEKDKRLSVGSLSLVPYTWQRKTRQTAIKLVSQTGCSAVISISLWHWLKCLATQMQTTIYNTNSTVLKPAVRSFCI